MKEFSTAVAELEAEQQDGDEQEPAGTLHFDITETDAQGNKTATVPCVAYKPGDGQLAVLMASTGRSSSSQEQVAGVINFFASVLDDESNSYVVSRLLNRRDPFGLEQVQEIMAWMIEEWAGRPTKPSSGSTGSRKRTGPRSTEATPALT